MKILKYMRLKDDFYKIKLENNSDIKVHEDLILKYNLLLTKEIDEDTMLKIEKENQNYLTYNMALKYISKKLRSQKELDDYLTKKGVGGTSITNVINILKKQGYINNEVYLNAYINDKINLSSEGPLKIKRDLINKGFSQNEIELKLEVFSASLEEDRINKIITKNLKTNKKSLYQFKIKMSNYLRGLGYSNELIYKCLATIIIDEDALYKLEYEKLYKKYSKKHSDKELEYKIKQALYMKGFTK